MVPGRVRAIFALTIAFVCAPLISPSMSFLNFNGTYILIAIQELLLGVAMGFALQIVFQVFILAGQIVALQAGLGFATMIDPTSRASVPLLGQLYLFIVSLIFLALNGHIAVIGALMDSFQQLPLGHNVWHFDSILALIKMSGWMFKQGVLVALPAILSMLIVSLTFGIMTKVAPQLNIFSIGFPITLLMGIIIIRFGLPGLSQQIEQSLEIGMNTIYGMFQ
jgi:flagellar biosynthetic protein FliR